MRSQGASPVLRARVYDHRSPKVCYVARQWRRPQLRFRTERVFRSYMHQLDIKGGSAWAQSRCPKCQTCVRRQRSSALSLFIAYRVMEVIRAVEGFVSKA